MTLQKLNPLLFAKVPEYSTDRCPKLPVDYLATVLRNENFRIPDRPYLDRIIFKIIADANSRSLAFEKGDVDLLDYETCNYADYNKLSSLPNVTVYPPFGDRMPQGGPYLPEATVAIIRTWIDQGAQDN